MGVILMIENPYKWVENRIPPRHTPVNSVYQLPPEDPRKKDRCDTSYMHDTM